MFTKAVKSVVFVVSVLGFMTFAKTTFAYTTNMNASVVIGQPNFISSDSIGGPTGLNFPSGIASDGTHLAIADLSNNRVLVFNSIPTTNGAAADVVIGQADFNSTSANQGGSTAANTLRNPLGVAFANGKLLIADKGNNRVLIFNKIPTTNNASADVVIGQSSFTGNGSACSSTRYDSPIGIDYDPVSGKLAISDYSDERVLLYNSIPTTNGAAADVEIGWGNFTCSGNTLFNTASGVRFAGGKLLVAERGNNRVVVFNSIPTQNTKTGDVFIGQPNSTSTFANQGGNPAANTLNGPLDIAWDGKRLYILDYNNARALIYSGIPETNNASAYMVIGQPDFASNSSNQGLDTPQAYTLCRSTGTEIGIFTMENKLIISDNQCARVLVFNNTIQSPALSLTNSITAGTGGKLRMYGRATVDSLYTVSQIMASVNGGDFKAVTASDNNLDSAAENFYFDFLESDNGNKLEGYTMRIKARNTNLDDTEFLFFFTPFNANWPPDKESTTAALPTFDFSVNKQRLAMRDYVQKYQIQIAKDGTSDWKVYIDNIPVDFQSVKNLNDNLGRSFYENASTNNGIYETNLLMATYSQESSRVSVMPKDQVSHLWPFGKKLAPGTYKWKVVAIDKTGKTQETLTYHLKIEEQKPATLATSEVQGATTQQTPDVDGGGQPLPLPAPSPSPRIYEKSTKQQLSDNKFCIWFWCF